MGDYVLKVNDGKAAVATLLDLDAQFERLKKRGLDLQSRVKAREEDTSHRRKTKRQVTSIYPTFTLATHCLSP